MYEAIEIANKTLNTLSKQLHEQKDSLINIIKEEEKNKTHFTIDDTNYQIAKVKSVIKHSTKIIKQLEDEIISQIISQYTTQENYIKSLKVINSQEFSFQKEELKKIKCILEPIYRKYKTVITLISDINDFLDNKTLVPYLVEYKPLDKNLHILTKKNLELLNKALLQENCDFKITNQDNEVLIDYHDDKLPTQDSISLNQPNHRNIMYLFLPANLSKEEILDQLLYSAKRYSIQDNGIILNIKTIPTVHQITKKSIVGIQNLHYILTKVDETQEAYVMSSLDQSKFNNKNKTTEIFFAQLLKSLKIYQLRANKDEILNKYIINEKTKDSIEMTEQEIIDMMDFKTFEFGDKLIIKSKQLVEQLKQEEIEEEYKKLNFIQKLQYHLKR